MRADPSEGNRWNPESATYWLIGLGLVLGLWQ